MDIHSHLVRRLACLPTLTRIEVSERTAARDRDMGTLNPYVSLVSWSPQICMHLYQLDVMP
jgi:hypothetical protein